MLSLISRISGKMARSIRCGISFTGMTGRATPEQIPERVCFVSNRVPGNQPRASRQRGGCNFIWMRSNNPRSYFRFMVSGLPSSVAPCRLVSSIRFMVAM